MTDKPSRNAVSDFLHAIRQDLTLKGSDNLSGVAATSAGSAVAVGTGQTAAKGGKNVTLALEQMLTRRTAGEAA